MCLEMKFITRRHLRENERRIKHIVEKGYICRVTLYPRQSIQKRKEQQKVEKGRELQVENECHKYAT